MSGFFIYNHNISAFKVYRPVICSWREPENWHVLLLYAGQGIVTYLLYLLAPGLRSGMGIVDYRHDTGPPRADVV